MRIVLGVGAGIAAYKSCELLRLLTESGHDVRVVPTPDALRFVGEHGTGGEDVSERRHRSLMLNERAKACQRVGLLCYTSAA